MNNHELPGIVNDLLHDGSVQNPNRRAIFSMYILFTFCYVMNLAVVQRNAWDRQHARNDLN